VTRRTRDAFHHTATGLSRACAGGSFPLQENDRFVGFGDHVITIEDDLGRMEVGRFLDCLAWLVGRDIGFGGDQCAWLDNAALLCWCLLCWLLAQLRADATDNAWLMSQHTSSSGVCGLPACAVRSSAKAFTVSACRPGVANITLRASRSMNSDT
jgi:hypothetical protein